MFAHDAACYCKLIFKYKDSWHGCDETKSFNCRQTYNIIRTKSPNLNDFGPINQLSLPNPLKQGVKSRIKMWEQRRQTMLQLHVINNSIAYYGVTYIRSLTVTFMLIFAIVLTIWRRPAELMYMCLS